MIYDTRTVLRVCTVQRAEAARRVAARRGADAAARRVAKIQEKRESDPKSRAQRDAARRTFTRGPNLIIGATVLQCIAHVHYSVLHGASAAEADYIMNYAYIEMSCDDDLTDEVMR